MCQCKVHLVIPCLVDSGQVLGQLFDEWNENEAQKEVTDLVDIDDIFDLLDKEDGVQGNKGDGD